MKESSMPEILPVESRREREAFLRLPWRIYRDDPHWVPPILAAQRRELDQERGPFFTDGFGSRAAFFLAMSGGEVVGRIAAIRNERHLAQHHDRVGFFGFFESVDDPSVAGALLEKAEDWLKAEGLVVSRGPTSFTLSDPAGVTIEGGGIRPPVLLGHTPGYYANLLTVNGYHKARDLLGYRLSIEDIDSKLLRFGAELSLGETAGVEVREIQMNRLAEEAELFARVFSKAWERNWGAFPMVPQDFLLAAKEFGPFFDPRLGAVVTVHGEPAAVFLAVPDVWEILQKLDGRIGPAGLWRIWRDRHRLERLRLLIVGILPEYRKLPIGPLVLRQIRTHRDAFPSLRTIELAWILEDNRVTRELAESVQAQHCRTLRIYDKELDE
jgi:GNAT superfamily N-acetyltransferase